MNLNMNFNYEAKKEPQYPWIKFSYFNYSVSFSTYIHTMVASWTDFPVIIAKN